MLTQKDIEQFEAVHGEVVHCKGPIVEAKKDPDGNVVEPARPAWELVLKRPDGRKHYKMFRAMANDDKQRVMANETILRNGGMLVYPKVEEFDSLLERHYGVDMSSSVQKAISHLLGLESDETGKF